MTELTIRPEEIRTRWTAFVQSYEPGTASREEVGRVTDAGDGIAHVEGLPSAMANELLEFEDGTLGLALNLDVREIGVVVLGDFAGIEEGQPSSAPARSSRSRSATTSSAASSTRSATRSTASARSRPSERRALELQAPNVVQRKSVHEPLQTGIKSIDAMTADRPRPAPAHHRRPPDRQDRRSRSTRSSTRSATGSPATPTQQVRCIYVAIGQKGSTIASVRGTLEEAGALEYTTIVALAGVRPGRLQVPRALHRLGHRPALDVPGQARPHRLRRPEQAGRGLPRRVAAAAPSAGPRGLPG